jgi:DNA polymerase I-like protein with 3'-5' exonuclease and polymerase domains|tara:strand:- start:1063 stop:1593 length:531 start_codon:yes stop_codon:yes gene_type:complete
MLTVDKSTKFDWKNIPFVQCSEGNAMDTYFTLKVYGRLLEELQGKGLEALYEKLISPLTIAFRDIEFDGLLIDADKVASLKSELETKIEEAEVALLDTDRIPDDINLRSNQALCKVLFSMTRNKDTDGWDIDDSVGFGLYPFEWTKGGQPSTNQETLSKVESMITQEYVRRGLNVT